MKPAKVAAITLAVAGFSLAACGPMENPALIRVGEPVSAIEVRNAHANPVTDLRIGICGQTFGAGPDYGWDRLEGARIAPGASMRFAASPGCYNIAAITSGSGLLASGQEHFGVVQVTAGDPGVWTVR